MSVRRLNHAVLYVSNVARSVKFYRETLGFEISTEIAGRAAFLRAPGTANDHDLGLFQVGTAAQPFGKGAGARTPDGPPQPGLYHLAWEVGSLPELVDIRGKLAAHGALVGASEETARLTPKPTASVSGASRGSAIGTRATIEK